MRTLRLMFIGVCLTALSGCWCCHRPWFAYHGIGCGGCCTTPCCSAPVSRCSCYLGAPMAETATMSSGPVSGALMSNAEPPVFVPPTPQKGN